MFSRQFAVAALLLGLTVAPTRLPAQSGAEPATLQAGLALFDQLCMASLARKPGTVDPAWFADTNGFRKRVQVLGFGDFVFQPQSSNRPDEGITVATRGSEKVVHVWESSFGDGVCIVEFPIQGDRIAPKALRAAMTGWAQGRITDLEIRTEASGGLRLLGRGRIGTEIILLDIDASSSRLVINISF